MSLSAERRADRRSSSVINPVTELRGFFRAALVDQVGRDHQESAEALVQRRWISSVTLAVGSFMLAWSLRLAPGNPAYYAATLALSTTWIVGGLLSGKIYLGASRTRSGEPGRGVLQAVIIGVLALAIFLGFAALVASFTPLQGALLVLVAHAHYGFLPVVALLTLLNAIGEELFFRGALYAAVGGRQAMLVTTLVYALTTIPTGIPTLVLAAALVGVVVGLQRRVTGGVLAPVITHVIWSMGILFLLPWVLGA
jgi:membrane protease YdiL (CAAX protease family)